MHASHLGNEVLDALPDALGYIRLFGDQTVESHWIVVEQIAKSLGNKLGTGNVGLSSRLVMLLCDLGKVESFCWLVP